ncbi:MAG: ArsR family transcriptional regulator [Pseudobdellovibrio sp.]|jgi:DNA-binding HxlR family transcriptional regulator|nr:ArsR family transcriptional regulator [Pseudobdellovibrio sp.]
MLDAINENIHQPTRTRIIIFLLVHGETDFNSLKAALELSDGQVANQIKQLESVGYVEVKKEFFNRKPRTTYRLTESGRQNFSEYISYFENIIKELGTKI